MTTTLAAFVLCAYAAFPSIAQERHTYNLTLSHAATSADEAGRTVVTLQARGDLSGVFTIAMTRDAQGKVTGGEWALNVSYTESVPIDPALVSTADPDGGERLVQKGTIKGSVTSGTLAFNSDGSPSSVADVLLAVDTGTITYAGVSGGNGLLSATALGNREASNGALSLIF